MGRTPASILEFDDSLTAPIFGYQDREDYYKKASCVHRMPDIKVPTVFLNTMDDPILCQESIDFEVFKKNPNIVLCMTNHGGHTGHHESVFRLEQWFAKVAMQYFDIILDENGSIVVPDK